MKSEWWGLVGKEGATERNESMGLGECETGTGHAANHVFKPMSRAGCKRDRRGAPLATEYLFRFICIYIYLVWPQRGAWLHR
jgi:hypothetical protein